MSIQKRTRTIGKMHFGPEVDITDPSYERDVWCRKNDVSIKEGEYFCMISEVLSERVINGEDLSYSTVAKIAINLTEEMPDECDTEYIGEIGVDAGLAGFFRNKPNTTSEEWGEFCSRMDYNEDVAWIFEEGFFSSSGYGDGAYPAFAKKNENNEVTGLVVDFLLCEGEEEIW